MSSTGPVGPHSLRTDCVSDEPRLLWIGHGPAPANLQAAARGRWDVRSSEPESMEAALADAPLAVVHANGAAYDSTRLQMLLDVLEATSSIALLLAPADAPVREAIRRRASRVLFCAEDAPPGELGASIEAAAALQPGIARLRSKLAAAQQSDNDYRIFDEEMRLAARLQRDFLPRRLPEVGQVRFGVLYRPATWVSGDIYDAVRVDETHLGFYVADAVGHGMPAALLTMFIKRALQMKRIAGGTYEIIPPDASVEQLNRDICEQDLSSCQFCTAVHCVLNVNTLEMEYCRAGHPTPLLLRADGSVLPLDAPGSLVGVFEDERFTSRSLRLLPGDRLLLYSDGAEPFLLAGESPDQPGEAIRRWAELPRDELLLELSSRSESDEFGPAGADDVTVLVVDVETGE